MVTRVAEVGGTGNLVSTVHSSIVTMGVTLGTMISAVTISMFGDGPAVAMWTGAGLATLAKIVLSAQTPGYRTHQPG